MANPAWPAYNAISCTSSATRSGASVVAWIIPTVQRGTYSRRRNTSGVTPTAAISVTTRSTTAGAVRGRVQRRRGLGSGCSSEVRCSRRTMAVQSAEEGRGGMVTKTELHEIVDQLPDVDVEAAARYLKGPRMTRCCASSRLRRSMTSS